MRKGLHVVVVALAALAAGAPVASAGEGEKEGCFTAFGHCMEAAANIDSFWYRTAAALECELELIECTRIKLIGA